MKIRALEPRDMGRLIELHQEQNERDGTNYPLPRMFAPTGRLDEDIAFALAVERKGQVSQGIYFHAPRIVEMCFAGCDPWSTAYARREMPAVRYALRSMGYESLRCVTPKAMVDSLSAPLEAAGFTRLDERFANFYLDLRKEAP